MNSSDPQFTSPAMDVIRRYDPETYRDIAADDGWKVSTGPVPDGADATTEIGEYTEDGYVIYSRDQRSTNLNRENIEAGAAYLRVPVADYEASVIVHEYAHHATGQGEVTAYEASVRFDARLPARDRRILEADAGDLHGLESGDQLA